MLGDAELGRALVDGNWRVDGARIAVGAGSIWDVSLGAAAGSEPARQAFLWLDDLAALGARPARELAQGWCQDWIRRYGSGKGSGWTPELAGRRVKRWTAHAAMLTQGLDRTATERFWRALAGHQRYLSHAWEHAPAGVPRLRALTGLVWSGLVVEHDGHKAACAALGRFADEMIDGSGGVATRAPEDLAEAVILLIWTARLLEDAGGNPPATLLAAVARAVPVLRQLRLGDGSFARFHGGDAGSANALDQALAELRLGVQPKPRTPMGFARLTGGRVALVMDAASPPNADEGRPAASTLAFELSIGREQVIVNAGPGARFGVDWEALSRQTAAHSTVEVDGVSSARLVTGGVAARTFGPRLVEGPSLVSLKQAHDATGMWLLATHDGYVESHGLLHERRLFVDGRGAEVRGEEILSVTDARARARFDRAARAGSVAVAARFHLHPGVTAEIDPVRQIAVLTLGSGAVWVFRAGGGFLELEDTVFFDADAPRPLTARQVVVRAEVLEYLAQITWSIAKVSEPPEPSDSS